MIGEVLSSEVTTEGASPVRDVKVDLGGGDIRTPSLFSASGDDSPPLPLDQGVLVPIPGAGRYAIVGFIDPLNAPEANPGERRLSARSQLGTIVVWVHLKNDGTAEISNGAGTWKMEPSGTIDMNGFRVDPSGNVTTPGTVQATGAISSEAEVTAMSAAAPVNLSTHMTPGPFGPQGPPTPNT